MENTNVIWEWSDGSTHKRDFNRQELASLIRAWRRNANIIAAIDGIHSVKATVNGISAHVTWKPNQ